MTLPKQPGDDVRHDAAEMQRRVLDRHAVWPIKEVEEPPVPDELISSSHSAL